MDPSCFNETSAQRIAPIHGDGLEALVLGLGSEPLSALEERCRYWNRRHRRPHGVTQYIWLRPGRAGQSDGW